MTEPQTDNTGMKVEDGFTLGDLRRFIARADELNASDDLIVVAQSRGHFPHALRVLSVEPASQRPHDCPTTEDKPVWCRYRD